MNIFGRRLTVLGAKGSVYARNLGPPKPLSETLETLAEMDGGVLVQLNDRAPQHLYPKLADRGYSYETVETDGTTVTVIWEE